MSKTLADYKDLIEAENKDNADLGKRSLFFLARHILNYELIDEFHRPLCDEISEINDYILYKVHPEDFAFKPPFPRQRLWLWARGHLKTTLITIAHSIQLVLLNPNIRILISHNKLENAKGVLSQIKWHFTRNRTFRRTYPEFCPKANKDGKIEWGTTEHCTVPNRTRVYGEPTIDTAGVDTTKTGRHYDYMKKDDIVWEKSVTNEEQLEATRTWDSLTIPMFDNAEEALQDYIGTRYHFADIYSHLLKTEIKKSIIPAWNDNGEIAWKERYTKDGLEKIMKDKLMSPYVFYCQYLLQPTDPEHMEFKEEWLIYREIPVSEQWTFYVMVDPAGEKKKTSDYTVMVVVGIDEKGKYHLVDGIRDKLYLHERIKKLADLVKKWKPFRVSYERIGMQADLQEIDRLKKEGKFPYITIDEVKLSAKETKNDRIRGLQGIFSSEAITIPKELKFFSTYHKELQDFIQAFMYEFLQFPMSEHDDILDTLSQITRLNIIRGKTVAKKIEDPKGETFMDAVKKIKTARNIMNNDPYYQLTMTEAQYLVNRS